MTSDTTHPDYQRVERAIRFITDRYRDQPELEEVAEHLGLSAFHVQRLFTRWAGVSPKRFLQYVTLEHAKRLLQESRTVLEASWDAGLSGPGRLHDLTVTLEGVTPGQYRSGGAEVDIAWGVHPTPFGPALLAATERGLTTLSFLDADGVEPRLDELKEQWPGARVQEDPRRTEEAARRIFGGDGAARQIPESDGDGGEAEAAGLLRRSDDGPGAHLRLHVRGTNFQIRVWEALLRLPPATAVTYADLAEAVGRPDAARAVGNAVGRNPVALIIPCHRVLRSNGTLGGYRWGETRKQALLAWESARAS